MILFLLPAWWSNCTTEAFQQVFKHYVVSKKSITGPHLCSCKDQVPKTRKAEGKAKVKHSYCTFLLLHTERKNTGGSPIIYLQQLVHLQNNSANHLNENTWSCWMRLLMWFYGWNPCSFTLQRRTQVWTTPRVIEIVIKHFFNQKWIVQLKTGINEIEFKIKFSYPLINP